MQPMAFLENIKGVLARENVSFADSTITDDEAIIFIEEGEHDPTIVVQVVERHTGGDYQGETNDNDGYTGLRFSAP